MGTNECMSAIHKSGARARSDRGPVEVIGGEVSAGKIECIKRWLVFWHNSDEFVRRRVRRAWKLSLEQLRDGSSRWMKVQGWFVPAPPHELEAGWC